MLCFYCSRVGHRKCVEEAKQNHFTPAPAGAGTEGEWVCGECWSELERNRASAAEAQVTAVAT
jgi:hypothetical protein